ncbi:MAG: cupin domain-containing protein [Pseudomonadota bacterium]|nr:MAG: cupin [Pseudomonadota bacterium]
MSTERRHPNVINADEIEPTECRQGKFHVKSRPLARHAGNQQLGAQLLELAPGERAFPLHYHCANEEACYVLSGRGTARIGECRVPIRAGDWIAYPIGPEHAQKLVNDGDEPLVYLCLSTKHKCEIVGYPDSNKVGVVAGPSFENPWIREIHRLGESLPYYEGEPDAQE